MAHSLAPFLAIPFPSPLSHASEAVTRSVMERLFILGGEINYPPFWAKPHFKVCSSWFIPAFSGADPVGSPGARVCDVRSFRVRPYPLHVIVDTPVCDVPLDPLQNSASMRSSAAVFGRYPDEYHPKIVALILSGQKQSLVRHSAFLIS